MTSLPALIEKAYTVGLIRIDSFKDFQQREGLAPKEDK